MKVAGYKLDLDPTVNELSERGYSLIGLHLPEGLKRYAKDIASCLEKSTRATIVIASDPCYGACDLADESFFSLGIEASVEVGHAAIPYLTQKIPTFFVNATPTIDVCPVIGKAIRYLEGKRIGLVTTYQWAEKLGSIKKLLREEGLFPLTSKGDKRISSEGLVLGCNVSAAKRIEREVSSFLFIGEGDFHPVALLLSLDKPLIQADPISNRVRKEELIKLKEKIIKQRYQAVDQAKDAETYGVLVSTKKGQQRIKLARELKEKIGSHGKKAYIFMADELRPDKFDYLKGIDCLVSTCCPRVAIDDFLSYKLPIITPVELEMALGERKLERYKLDELI
ncbi:MAG TPA: diphthamide biosynthesis enzyme Dph2 [Thermoplasmata archaeon]|nr:diphthamide biosynthesis enzyme Dph2 [Thermoplasmata archaeon]